MARAASAHRTAGAPAGTAGACLAARDAACHIRPYTSGRSHVHHSLPGGRMTRCLRRWPAGLVLLAAAAPLTLLLAACQAPSHTAEVVVLLPSATANEPAPTLAPGDRALLYHAPGGRPGRVRAAP